MCFKIKLIHNAIKVILISEYVITYISIGSLGEILDADFLDEFRIGHQQGGSGAHEDTDKKKHGHVYKGRSPCRY